MSEVVGERLRPILLFVVKAVLFVERVLIEDIINVCRDVTQNPQHRFALMGSPLSLRCKPLHCYAVLEPLAVTLAHLSRVFQAGRVYEPLLAGSDQHRLLTAPVVRVTVYTRLLLQQRSSRAQHRDH